MRSADVLALRFEDAFPPVTLGAMSSGTPITDRTCGNLRCRKYSARAYFFKVGTVYQLTSCIEKT